MVDGGIEWDIHFEYPVNSHLHIIFSDGEKDVIRGTQIISSGRPIFDKPTIVKIEPPSDDIYQYTF